MERDIKTWQGLEKAPLLLPWLPHSGASRKSLVLETWAGEGQPLWWKKVEECLRLGEEKTNLTLHLGPGWRLEARFPAQPGPGLRQGLNQDTSLSVVSCRLQALALALPLLPASVSPLVQRGITSVLLCCDPCQVFPLPALSRKQRTVLVVCGPEQNGAVGLVCARHLRVFVSSKEPLGLPRSPHFVPAKIAPFS